MLADVWAGGLIGFREAMEATIIVVVFILILKKSGRPEMMKNIWKGVGAGVVASIITAILFKLVIGSFEDNEAWFEGGKIKLNFPEDGEEQMTSLVFEKTDVIEQERQLSPKLTQFLELANSLADPEGIVDRVQLRERAVADEVAKDFPKVRGFIKSLKGKNMIEVIDATQIRLKDLP